MGNKSTILLWLLVLCSSIAIVAISIGAITDSPSLPGEIANLFDRGPVTNAILGIFAAAVLLNFRNTLYVCRQRKLVGRGVRQERNARGSQVIGEGLLGTHIERLYAMYGARGSVNVDQQVSLSAIRNQLFRREWVVRNASGLLLTLGLVGTVLGLTSSLGGLSNTVNAVAVESLASATPQAESERYREDDSSSSDSEVAKSSEIDSPQSDVSLGLNQALGGMATAFFTTLFGAVLGGIFLKLLCGCTDSLIESLIDQIELVTETSVVPLLKVDPRDELVRQQKAYRKLSQTLEMTTKRKLEQLAQVSRQLGIITQRFERLSTSIANAENQLVGAGRHTTLLAQLGQNAKRWESILNGRMTQFGMAAIWVIALLGAARFVWDFVS